MFKNCETIELCTFLVHVCSNQNSVLLRATNIPFPKILTFEQLHNTNTLSLDIKYTQRLCILESSLMDSMLLTTLPLTHVLYTDMVKTDITVGR